MVPINLIVEVFFLCINIHLNEFDIRVSAPAVVTSYFWLFSLFRLQTS